MGFLLDSSRYRARGQMCSLAQELEALIFQTTLASHRIPVR
jgi:hypothetical protein